MAFIQTDRYSLHSYECDATGRLGIPALMNLMQESANRNAEAYGIDTGRLVAQGLGWMLMRFGLTMHHYPQTGQSIRVITYPTYVEKFLVYRDFRVLADDDTLLAEASSTWLVFDAARRGLVPLPAFIRELEPPTGTQCSPKLPLKPDYLTVAFAGEPVDQVRVGWFDIDANQHVNNVVYVRWLLEQLPDAVFQQHELASLDVVYRTETHWRDQIHVQHQPTDPATFVHRLTQADTGKDVLLAKTAWRKTDPKTPPMPGT